MKPIRMPAAAAVLFAAAIRLYALPFSLPETALPAETQPDRQSADSAEQPFSLQDMLAGYFAQDAELRTLALKLQQAKLQAGITAAETGVDAELATGTVSFNTSGVRAEPAVTVSIPALNGTVVSASVPLSYAVSADSAQSFSAAGAELSIGTELSGSTAAQRTLAVQKAQRAVTEAQRNLGTRARTAEYEFYTELKDLYSAYKDVLSARTSLYETRIDMETLRVKGFSAQSASYRTAQLEADSAERTVSEYERALKRAAERFAAKCGVSAGGLSGESLPDVQTQLVQCGVLDSDQLGSKERYAAVEQAEWDLYVAQLEQHADKTPTVTAKASYTYKNSSLNGADSAGASLSVTGNGLTVSGGVTVPIAAERTTPSGTVSLSWSPADTATSALEKRQNLLTLEIKQAAREAAADEYERAVEDAATEREDLLWQRTLNGEQYRLYAELAADMKTWFDAGIVSESEYRKAVSNEQNALIQCRITDINLIRHAIAAENLFIAAEDL